MEKYNFKVIAELRDDLSEEERAFAEDKIKSYQNQFKIVNTDGSTYLKRQPITGNNDDYGAVIFFYFALEDMKNYFERLAWYDIRGGRERVAV